MWKAGEVIGVWEGEWVGWREEEVMRKGSGWVCEEVRVRVGEGMVQRDGVGGRESSSVSCVFVENTRRDVSMCIRRNTY